MFVSICPLCMYFTMHTYAIAFLVYKYNGPNHLVYQTSSKSSTRHPIEILLLLDIQQSYFSATGRLVDIYSFQWMSSRQLFFCNLTSSRKFLLDSRHLVENPLIDIQQSRRFGPLSFELQFLFLCQFHQSLVKSCKD